MKIITKNDLSLGPSELRGAESIPFYKGQIKDSPPLGHTNERPAHYV